MPDLVSSLSSRLHDTLCGPNVTTIRDIAGKIGWRHHFYSNVIRLSMSMPCFYFFFFPGSLFSGWTPVTLSIQVNMHGYSFFFSLFDGLGSCRDAISARRATPLHLASQLQPDALTLTQCLLHFCHQQCHCTHPTSDLGGASIR